MMDTGGLPPGLPMGQQNLTDTEQDPNAPKKEEKPPKVRKPLESYFFNDSVRTRENFVWNIDLERNNVNIRSVDTVLNVFQVDYPFMRQDVGSAYLGNLGAAAIPLNYFTRPQYRNYEFAQAYDVYFYTPTNVKFYNVKHPFTQMSYYSSGQKKYAEEYLYVSHAQNISPSSGFNFDYKSRGTKGIYTNQKTRDKNLSLAFSHTGKKYTFHGGYIYNAAILRENGGVTDDWFVTDTIMELSENIPVNLLDARNTMKNNTFYMVHSYGVPLRRLSEDDFSIADRSSFYIGLSSRYSRFHKTYTDTFKGTVHTDDQGVTHEFYDDWYINSGASHDSIFESLFSNRAFIQLQPWSRDGLVGLIDAGVGVDMHHYYQMRMGEFLSGPWEGEDKTSYYAYGSVEGKLRRWADWTGDLKYNPGGYRSGDLDFGVALSLHAYSKKRPLSLSGSFRSAIRSPGYWMENYFSNHYIWSNSFDKETETRLEIRFTAPHLALELGGFQSLITDKIYFDATGVPAQSSAEVSVTGVYASKEFRLGGLHLLNRVLLQWSTDHTVVPVPMASAFATWYYDFTLVKNVLRMQLGVDGNYNTPYYAFGYNPATAQFYNQREKELGNYIMMDAFAAAKWKRMRILLKFQHVNENLWGARNYFTVLHYPQNQRVLKIGISWGFYD
ncbi:MAG: putative porin [Rikenellaceae bacterium]|nr:putative porin [Rikenellaceae bacterium]